MLTSYNVGQQDQVVERVTAENEAVQLQILRVNEVNNQTPVALSSILNLTAKQMLALLDGLQGLDFSSGKPETIGQ